MPAPDEARAASLLAGYLLARGWTVRLAGESQVEARRDGEQLALEPVLDAAGLDRVIVTRRWAVAAGAAPAALEALALELNERLNVGQFRAAPDALEFQASLAFLDTLEPRLLDAFLAYTAEVGLAVRRVEGDRGLLAPVESGPGSR